MLFVVAFVAAAAAAGRGRICLFPQFCTQRIVVSYSVSAAVVKSAEWRMGCLNY